MASQRPGDPRAALRCQAKVIMAMNATTVGQLRLGMSKLMLVWKVGKAYDAACQAMQQKMAPVLQNMELLKARVGSGGSGRAARGGRSPGSPSFPKFTQEQVEQQTTAVLARAHAAYGVFSTASNVRRYLGRRTFSQWKSALVQFEKQANANKGDASFDNGPSAGEQEYCCLQYCPRNV